MILLLKNMCTCFSTTVCLATQAVSFSLAINALILHLNGLGVGFDLLNHLTCP